MEQETMNELLQEIDDQRAHIRNMREQIDRLKQSNLMLRKALARYEAIIEVAA